MIEIRIYSAAGGHSPFAVWHASLSDPVVKLRIQKRIERLRLGNFGDCKSVGNGIHELRFAFGSGYRVYYAKEEEAVVILLCGGDKSSQRRDIEKAKAYWKDYKDRRYETLH